jgi:uncharacterized protein YjiS (DUF1127 family)
MSTRIAKEELAILMPNRLAHYFEPDETVGPSEPHRSLWAKVSTALAWLMEMPRRRAVLDELNALSDHELADIGLVRSDLVRVFDADFLERTQPIREGMRRPVHA